MGNSLSILVLGIARYASSLRLSDDARLVRSRDKPASRTRERAGRRSATGYGNSGPVEAYADNSCWRHRLACDFCQRLTGGRSMLMVDDRLPVRCTHPPGTGNVYFGVIAQWMQVPMP